MNQANQLTQSSLAAQVVDIFQGRVVVHLLADLDEKDPTLEVVHDRLVPAPVPPLDGKVVLAAGTHDPDGQVAAIEFIELKGQSLFILGEVDVAGEDRGRQL